MPGRRTGGGVKRVRTLRARVTDAFGAEFDALRTRLGLSESDALRLAVTAWMKREGRL